jgi:general secretion pathway protein E
MSQPEIEIKAGTVLQRLPVGDDPLTVGRMSNNTIVISDDMASRNHCVIERTLDGHLQVRDLGSKNGTLVNGQRVQKHVLNDGDEIRIGKVTLRLIDPQATAATTTDDEIADGDAFDVVEDISEDDIIEDIAEEDVIDDLDAPLVPVGGAEDEPELSDAVAVLQNLVDELPEPAVDATDIGLINSRGQTVHPSGPQRKSEGRTDAVEALRLIMLICLRNRATDIHLEPKQNYYQIRIRVDGIMVELAKTAPELGVRISALVKILSDIDIAQRNIVQEGHFSAVAPTIERGRLKPTPHRIDYRVSFAPAVHGQKLVIRILDTTNAPLRLADLQLPPWMQEAIGNAIQQESGMVLVVGPTGSGKTTSLYALLRTIPANELNVMTIEDPVEIELPSVTQMPVDEPNGKSFSVLLKSILRQDPDVILVGEIRDPETARIAMQAAITGHLVFSTLHTKDSVGTVFRLLDLGVEPYLCAQGLQVVLAQRLTRQLCPYCKKPVRPTAEQQEKLKATVGPLDRVYVPQGCKKCLNTGFSGRQAFFELLQVNERLRNVIQSKPSLDEITKALADSPFKRLEHSGHLLVAAGLASFDEIERSVVR